MAAIRPTEVQTFVKGLSGDLSPSTVRVVHSRVVAIFAAAVRDRRIASTPCVGISLPKRTRVKVEPLPTEAVRALIEAVADRYRAVVVLAAGTGLRQGECFGLDVERVDFLRRQVRVDRQLVTVAGHGPQFGPPKTEASVRTVPLPTVVLEELASHVATYKPGRMGPMFSASNGGPIWRSSWSLIWTAAVKATGSGLTRGSMRCGTTTQAS